MRTMVIPGLAVMLAMSTLSCQGGGGTAGSPSGVPNTLSAWEQREGWVLLFDGKTLSGWRGVGKPDFPTVGWAVENGMLVVNPAGKDHRGGDIITVAKYSEFEFCLEFKLTPGANSGIKYFVDENIQNTRGYGVGLEYQILDDANHPDADKGRPGTRKTASLYDILAAGEKVLNPPGVWNRARIVVRGNHVEHWLNGRKVLEYQRGSESFAKLVSESKFASQKDFGLAVSGHILLQDHADTVYFRNIKIRTF